MKRSTVSAAKAQTIRTLFICAVVAVLVFSSTVIIQAKTDSDIHAQKYYTSYEIQPGDTLSSIAEEHMSVEYKNVNAYIEDVMATNGLKSTDIHAGQHLTIPYYAYEEL